MTIAELKGKLSPHTSKGLHDRMEDLLTSDVFGTMQYAGWEYGFIKWLRSAQNPYDLNDTGNSIFPESEQITNVLFDYWPTLSHKRQPDLMMCIEEKGKCTVLIMVEAKYLSGPSDSTVPEEWEPGNDSGNQLAEQINDFPDIFRDLSIADTVTRVHLYVTAHFLCPTVTYWNSEEYLRRKDVKRLWLNWQSLHEHLQGSIELSIGGTREMLADLLLLLERKNLNPYKGYQNKVPKKAMWQARFTFWKDNFWKKKPSHYFAELSGYFTE